MWNLLQTAGFCLFHSHLPGTELCLLGGSKVSSSLEYKFFCKVGSCGCKDTQAHAVALDYVINRWSSRTQPQASFMNKQRVILIVKHSKNKHSLCFFPIEIRGQIIWNVMIMRGMRSKWRLNYSSMLKLLIDILEHDWNLNSNNQSIFENKHQWSFKFQIVFIYIQFIKKQL